MITPRGVLRGPDLAPILARLSALENMVKRTTGVAAVANAGVTQAAKRFRIGMFSTPLVTLGGAVSGSVLWSSPMPSASYNVDAACAAMGNIQWTFTTSNQTAAGVTVNFSAPVALALGTLVTVVAVSPAS